MKALALVLAVGLGQYTKQCTPSGCYLIATPAQAQAATYPAPPPPVYPSTQSAGPVIGLHRVLHQGLEFTVQGYADPKTGMIILDPGNAFNERSYAEAFDKQEKAKAAAAKATAEKATAKADIPKAGEVGATGIPNYGLAMDKIGQQKNVYTVSTPEAKRFVETAKSIEADDDDKLHVTVIGSESEAKQVTDDIANHSAFVGLRDRLLVQEYRPGEWAVDRALGFPANGSPAIVIETAKRPDDPKGGRVVLRTNTYQGGPQRLAEEIRRADPAYRPSLDPMPGRLPFGLTEADLPTVLAVACGAGLLFFLPKRKD